MGDSVPVRCPECLRTQAYAAPVFPCACGTPVVPPVIPGATGEPVTHRNWTDEWVTVRCAACGREDAWPHPELGCTCGTVLRVPVLPPTGGRGPAEGTGPGTGAGDGTGRGTGAGTGADSDTGPWRVVDPRSATDARPGTGTGTGTGTGGWFTPGNGGDGAPEGHGGGHPFTGPGPGPAENRAHAAPQTGGHRAFADRYPTHIPLPPTAPHPAPPRPSFRPVTIRTARDAVAASAGYLRWLGFRDVVQPEERSTSEVDLRAPGLVAQVDPSTRPAGLRAVECLWLNGLSSTAVSVFFSLAGYTPEARSRADELGIPLFVLDLTGTPQPVNTPADELVTTGA
ncbi:hypothetical protein [Streptomyces sp. NPDC001927]